MKRDGEHLTRHIRRSGEAALSRKATCTPKYLKLYELYSRWLVCVDELSARLWKRLDGIHDTGTNIHGDADDCGLLCYIFFYLCTPVFAKALQVRRFLFLGEYTVLLDVFLAIGFEMLY